MHNDNEQSTRLTTGRSDSTEPSNQPKGSQQQSDPQLTELKGFTDSKEELEPVLEDGTKAPDKAPPENVNS